VQTNGTLLEWDGALNKLCLANSGFVTIVLLLSLLGVPDPVRSVGAEESLQASAIEHLSTDAVLAEDGSRWYVRVRFTTSVPAICHVTSGPSAAALKAGSPEIEALRTPE